MKNYRSQRRPSTKPFVRARKSLGQNFLVDQNAVIRIIDACSLKREETVLEIGPGTGLLTRQIAPVVKELIAVETDPRFCETLNGEFRDRNVRIVHADFLKVDLTQLLPAGNKVKVIGNLPYYITTPIITTIIGARSLFRELFLTVQLEFAERIAAQPGGKEYGAFSCFVQFYAEPTLLFKIKSSSFKPRPKVDSCFLRLTLREKPLFELADEEFLFKIIRTSFQQRRKTLSNSLSVLFPKETLAGAFVQAGIDPQRRAESLSLADFVRLSEALGPAKPSSID
jgi:16S rRNA (adenine1518-N6/adenine1519-N6)-dimethyltransferase